MEAEKQESIQLLRDQYLLLTGKQIPGKTEKREHCNALHLG